MKGYHFTVMFCALVMFSGCFQNYYSGYRGGPPKFYDKYGFPIGGKNRLLTSDGFVVRDFQLDLESMIGVSCNAGNSQQYTNMYMHREALAQFEAMQAAARRDNIKLSICSAYRDYDYQKRVQRQYPGKAISPGYSEHHLGTAVDMADVWWGSNSYRWLKGNAHRFGFILSYYRTQTSGEANHWRYVGVDAARAYYDWFGEMY